MREKYHASRIEFKYRVVMMSPFFNVIGLFHTDDTIEHRNIEIWNSDISQIIIALKFYL